MNILYSGDKNIWEGLAMSVLSLLDHVDDVLNIYILTARVEESGRICYPLDNEKIKALDELSRNYNDENFVKLYDISEYVAECPPIANMKTRFTPGCMFRLYADKVKVLPDKILYLDNDVICRSDISDFYYQDMGEYEISGVLDYYGRWFFRHNPFKSDYINSGVLLMNLDKIRETDLFEKCRQRCKIKKMFMPDQSAINKYAKKKKLCSRIYNEQRRQTEDTVMRHFTTNFRFFPIFKKISVKPWKDEDMHSVLEIYEYDELLMRSRNI